MPTRTPTLTLTRRRAPAVRSVCATVVVIAGMGGLLAPTPASAEPSRFHTLPVQALDAHALFEPLRKTALPLGTALKLVPSQQAAAREHFAKGFQVRVFRVTGPGTLPAVLAEFEPCLVYLGQLFQFRGGNDLDEVSLGRLAELNWLTLQVGRAPENGRFLLVAEPLGQQHDLFRIEKGEKGQAIEKYFATGLYFEVAPDGSIGVATANAELEAARQRWSMILDAAKKNDASLDCVRTAEFALPDTLGWLTDAQVCGGSRPDSDTTPDDAPAPAAPAHPA